MVNTAGVEQTANCATMQGSERKDRTTATPMNKRDTQHKASVVRNKDVHRIAKGPQDKTVAVEEMFSHHLSSNNSGMERPSERRHSRM
jgi:hypothetical protein